MFSGRHVLHFCWVELSLDGTTLVIGTARPAGAFRYLSANNSAVPIGVKKRKAVIIVQIVRYPSILFSLN